MKEPGLDGQAPWCCRFVLSLPPLARLRADGITPTTEVRCIVFTKMGKRLDTFFGGTWIEDNLNEAQEAVVFDDEFATR